MILSKEKFDLAPLFIRLIILSTMSLKIFSWNINGYRDGIHEWLSEYIRTQAPDVIFLSETKKKPDFLKAKFDEFTDYEAIINSHTPWNYHGVAMLIRKNNTFSRIEVKMNIPTRKDTKTLEAADGRVIIIWLNQKFFVVGSYTPNSGHSDPVKLAYRTQTWDPAFVLLLEQLRRAGPTAWIGDINVALAETDVSNPVVMSTYAGFTLEERRNFWQLLNTGCWKDIWRDQHPDDQVFTWRGTSDPLKYGMRLDNIILSDNLVKDADETYMVYTCPKIADHIPICVNLKR